jgi:hypothetical protein
MTEWPGEKLAYALKKNGDKTSSNVALIKLRPLTSILLQLREKNINFAIVEPWHCIVVLKLRLTSILLN